MSDFHLVDPRGWEYDLQSVYSAYMGWFQLHGVPWYERSWGVFFESFEEFLTFSWPVITVTDCWTGRAHIVTRMTSIGAFLKMIKTRFGETMPMVENILRVSPFETSQRHLRTISDYAAYKKIHSTLPAAVLTALKARIRAGEPRAVRELWNAKDKTFFAIDFEWSERNSSSCLEWGYAAVRCGHLETLGIWPPDPEPNYRRGHYIVSEYVDKVHNRHRPNFPWAYAYGESHVLSKAKLPQVIQAVMSSFSSPDSETIANSLVLVGHGILGDLDRLKEMNIKIPHNMLILDTSVYERQLFQTGQRGNMQDPSGNPRQQGSTLSLTSFIKSLGVEPQCVLHNAGNDAMITLLGLQLLVEPGETKIPTPRSHPGNRPGTTRSGSRSPGAMPSLAFMPTPPIGPMPMYGMFPPASPNLYAPASPSLYGPGTPSLYPGGRSPEGINLDHDISSSRRSSGQSANQLSVNDRSASARRLSMLPPEGSLRSRDVRPRVSSAVSARELSAQLAAVKVRDESPNA